MVVSADTTVTGHLFLGTMTKLGWNKTVFPASPACMVQVNTESNMELFCVETVLSCVEELLMMGSIFPFLEWKMLQLLKMDIESPRTNMGLLMLTVTLSPNLQPFVDVLPEKPPLIKAYLPGKGGLGPVHRQKRRLCLEGEWTPLHMRRSWKNLFPECLGQIRFECTLQRA